MLTIVTGRLAPLPPQGSTALGGSKIQALPQATVLLVVQYMTGGRITTVTFWVQTPTILPEQSRMVQVPVIILVQLKLLVTALNCTVGFGQHGLCPTVGGSKVQAEPQATVLSTEQVIGIMQLLLVGVLSMKAKSNGTCPPAG